MALFSDGKCNKRIWSDVQVVKVERMSHLQFKWHQKNNSPDCRNSI
jgi:hypothetical protein